MKPIEFTLTSTLVIATFQTIEALLKELGAFTYTVQVLNFKSLEQVTAYRIQKAHLEREDKVYLFNKGTLELAFIPKLGVDALAMLLAIKGIVILDTLEESPVI